MAWLADAEFQGHSMGAQGADLRRGASICYVAKHEAACLYYSCWQAGCSWPHDAMVVCLRDGAMPESLVGCNAPRCETGTEAADVKAECWLLSCPQDRTHVTCWRKRSVQCHAFDAERRLPNRVTACALQSLLSVRMYWQRRRGCPAGVPYRTVPYFQRGYSGHFPYRRRCTCGGTVAVGAPAYCIATPCASIPSTMHSPWRVGLMIMASLCGIRAMANAGPWLEERKRCSAGWGDAGRPQRVAKTACLHGLFRKPSIPSCVS